MKQPVLTDLFVPQLSEEKNAARVAPLKACADGQDLPRRENELSPSLPSGRIAAVAKDCQREGKKRADVRRGDLHQRMMHAYELARRTPDRGFTDQELATWLDVARCVVNARRAELSGIVALGKRRNQDTGINNTVWGKR